MNINDVEERLVVNLELVKRHFKYMVAINDYREIIVAFLLFQKFRLLNAKNINQSMVNQLDKMATRSVSFHESIFNAELEQNLTRLECQLLNYRE